MSSETESKSAIAAHHKINDWYEEHKELFAPPVCNKLMFKEQLSVMFVGGPNTRTDFHLDLGSEFFFQMKGSMEVVTIQKGKRVPVQINAGQVWLLPSRVQHSPQRPEEGSLGLVIERQREKTEADGLRWFTDFDECNTVLYEHYFHCNDLGKDLVPVVKAYMSSEEHETKTPGNHVLADSDRPWQIDNDTEIPPPFMFADFLEQNKDAFANGESKPLFPNHPDKEFTILVASGGKDGTERSTESKPYDSWLYQHKGSATVSSGNETVNLEEGACCVIRGNEKYSVKRSPGSIGLVVVQDPTGNR